MAGEWLTTPLSELTEPETPVTYGVVKPGDADPEGVRFIRGGDIANGRILVEQLRTISKGVSNQYKRTLLRGGEIVMSLVGNPGQVAIVPDSLSGANIARQAALIRLRGDVDSQFVFYFLRSPNGQEAIGAHSRGSVQQVVNLRDLKTVPVPTPPLVEQRAIAHILGTLDDKIELNRRRNQTLEAMARALFKDWFVDFGPVRAKMEAREPYLPADLWQRFPDCLDDEGKPEGWELQPVYGFANVVYGAPFASKQFNTVGAGTPLIRIRDLASHEPGVWTEQIHQKGHLIEPGDIVVGMDGEFRLHVWKGQPAWLNQRVCHFEPLPGVPSSFLTEALVQPLAFFERGKVGTTVIHLGKSDIDTFRLLHPGDSVLKAFGNVAEPWLAAIVRNALESRTLAQLRDTLLPKLISGELRIADAEDFLERAECQAANQTGRVS